MDFAHGDPGYLLALRTRFKSKPRIKRFEGGWLCQGGTVVAGFGLTPTDAYVDHVEEQLLLDRIGNGCLL